MNARRNYSKIIFSVLCIIGLSHIYVFANSHNGIGLGVSINYQTNGILIDWIHSNRKRNLELNLGIRIISNITKPRLNDHNYLFYQNGYASNWKQWFGLNLGFNYNFWNTRYFRLGVKLNTLLSNHSILANQYDVDYSNNSLIWQSRTLLYLQAKPSLELTIGPNIEIKLNNKTEVHFYTGLGICLMTYNLLDGKDLLTGNDVNVILLDPYKTNTIKEVIGLDGIPTFGFTVNRQF